MLYLRYLVNLVKNLIRIRGIPVLNDTNIQFCRLVHFMHTYLVQLKQLKTSQIIKILSFSCNQITMFTYVTYATFVKKCMFSPFPVHSYLLCTFLVRLSYFRQCQTTPVKNSRWYSGVTLILFFWTFTYRLKMRPLKANYSEKKSEKHGRLCFGHTHKYCSLKSLSIWGYVII